MTDAYPNLTVCRVTLRGNNNVDRPPVTLPLECRQAAENLRLPPLYDFSVEKRVVQEHKDRQAGAATSSSPTAQNTTTATSSSTSAATSSSSWSASFKMPWQS